MEDDGKTHKIEVRNDLSIDNWQRPGSDCYMFATEQIINHNLSADETRQMLVDRGMNPTDANNLVNQIVDEMEDIAEKPSEVPGSPSATLGEAEDPAVPKCLKKWNMGAFVFSGIWGICNRVWWPIGAALVIALLSFLLQSAQLLPRLLALVLSIILGIEGNRMSWEQYKTDEGYTSEQFDKRQRAWNIAGWIGFAVVIIVSAAIAMEDI